ncbi:MAG: hypothetical protein NT096_00330 [Proteobacteria bacterium]|nr:hypothetical protein [Pseudomonadota bacterium]
MNNEKLIDVDGLIDMLQDFSGHTIAYIRTLTIPKFNQGHRVTKESMLATLGIEPETVRKISLYSVRIGYDYRTSVENALDRQGLPTTDYKAGTSWHRPYVLPSGQTSKTVVIHPNTREKYILATINKVKDSSGKLKANIKSMYVDMSTGKFIDKDLLKDFLPPKSAPKNQGLDEEHAVLVQTLKLASVKRLAFQGTVYNLA